MQCRKNDSAFPISLEDEEFHGLSKREYFAAAALQGLLSNLTVKLPKPTAVLAVEIADSLIRELNKSEANKEENDS